FLECAHAAAIGLRGAAKQDHWPAILLGIGEAGETVHHAGAGHNDAGAGAAGQIAVGLRRVGGGLLVAHADIGNPFLLRGCGDRGDRKPDDPEQVIDALLFEAPRYQGRAVDFAHAFLLVFQARDYALMARPRKGFAGTVTPRRPPRCARAQPPSPCARPSALMKSRRRIAFLNLGTRPSSASRLSEQQIATSEMGSQGSSCDVEFLSRQWQQRVKSGRAQNEQMRSALLPKADIVPSPTQRDGIDWAPSRRC